MQGGKYRVLQSGKYWVYSYVVTVVNNMLVTTLLRFKLSLDQG